MRYERIEDLPFVCRYNLPEPALHVYREEWNRAWEESRDRLAAMRRAWTAVRSRFEKDPLTGGWVQKHRQM